MKLIKDTLIHFKEAGLPLRGTYTLLVCLLKGVASPLHLKCDLLRLYVMVKGRD